MNRYQMDMPKIGIRPVIDGRRNGVRESLEDQTMGMALSATPSPPFFLQPWAGSTCGLPPLPNPWRRKWG